MLLDFIHFSCSITDRVTVTNGLPSSSSSLVTLMINTTVCNGFVTVHPTGDDCGIQVSEGRPTARRGCERGWVVRRPCERSHAVREGRSSRNGDDKRKGPYRKGTEKGTHKGTRGSPGTNLQRRNLCRRKR